MLKKANFSPYLIFKKCNLATLYSQIVFYFIFRTICTLNPLFRKCGCCHPHIPRKKLNPGHHPILGPSSINIGSRFRKRLALFQMFEFITTYYPEATIIRCWPLVSSQGAVDTRTLNSLLSIGLVALWEPWPQSTFILRLKIWPSKMEISKKKRLEKSKKNGGETTDCCWNTYPYILYKF